MKQLLLERGKVIPMEVAMPTLDDNSVLVRVCYSFISSGTENATIKNSKQSLLNKAFKNTNETIQKLKNVIAEHGISGAINLSKSKLHQYLPLGYSCSGKVIRVGKNVKGIYVDDFVACAGSSATHSEIVAVSKNLVLKIQNQKFLKETSICAIGAIALQGIRRANLQIGESVAIIGLGLIGLITLQLAKLAGYTVIGIDIDQSKLDLAKKLGCDFVLNSFEDSIKNEVNYKTALYGVDATIITAASSEGHLIDQAMEITRKKGKVVLVGDVKLDFSRELFYSKEIDFLISCSYGAGRYDSSYEKDGIDYPYAFVRWTEKRNLEFFIKLIETQKIDLSEIISAQIPFRKAQDAYEELQNKRHLGVVLSYEEDKEEKAELILTNSNVSCCFKPYKNLNVAFVGVGGFAKIKLLPIFTSFSEVVLKSVFDEASQTAASVASLYDSRAAKYGLEEILEDETINCVILATPHKFHAEYALAALRRGKAVFIEKPAAINIEELNNLKKFFENNKSSFYCVDFNRSFAPLIVHLKKSTDERITPLIINYRMNAGFIPKEHWVQSDEHGGRIIGEACHIFELFCNLTNSRPKTISVAPLIESRENLSLNDNFITNISFEDGSICSLTYTSIGAKKMSKERMEIFFDGKSAILDDYCELRGFDLPLSFNKKVPQSKGHFEIVEKFINESTSQNPSWPIEWQRIEAATKISFIVDRLVRAGGGIEKFNENKNF